MFSKFVNYFGIKSGSDQQRLRRASTQLASLLERSRQATAQSICTEERLEQELQITETRIKKTKQLLAKHRDRETFDCQRLQSKVEQESSALESLKVDLEVQGNATRTLRNDLCGIEELNQRCEVMVQILSFLRTHLAQDRDYLNIEADLVACIGAAMMTDDVAIKSELRFPSIEDRIVVLLENKFDSILALLDVEGRSELVNALDIILSDLLTSLPRLEEKQSDWKQRVDLVQSSELQEERKMQELYLRALWFYEYYDRRASWVREMVDLLKGYKERILH